MTSRMRELEELTLKGRKPTGNLLKALRRRFAGKGKLTNTEKRKLQTLKSKAKEDVTIANIMKNAPTLDVTITKDRKLPTGRGGTEPLFKKDGSPRLGSPKKKKGSSAVGTSGMGTRAGTQTGRRPGTNKPSTGKGSDKTLMPKSYKIKKGDTLTAIAKKMGTTVAMLKKSNSIKDANKIRAGQEIKIYKDRSIKNPMESRPRTVAQAQKMGKKYFFDKNGKRKAAVTAEQLKKSGLTLSQWLKKK